MRILVAFILLLPFELFGQYVSLQSQYMFNNVALNPAATGSEDALSIIGSFRAQWVGFPGAPRTQTLTVHAPLKKRNSALGIQLYADQIGVDNATGFYGLYSYRLKFKKSALRFGVAGGVTIFQANYSSLDVADAQDQLIASDAPIGVLPNCNVGIHWSSKDYFVSISIPQLLSHVYDGGKFRLRHDFKRYNYLIGGGYNFTLNNAMQLKPSVLFKYYAATRPQVDFNVRMQLNPLIDVGVSYRTKEAIIALTELRINKQFSFMYSFGIPLNPIAKYSFGSHELSVKYNFRYTPNSANPRYLGW